MSLSDRIFTTKNSGELDVIYYGDVKEFIKELKEIFDGFGNIYNKSNIHETIDKLAGEKLV